MIATRLSRALLPLLLLGACTNASEDRRTTRRPTIDSAGPSSALAARGADAPPSAVSSTAATTDSVGLRDVLEHLGQHLYQDWRPDSAESQALDGVCRRVESPAGEVKLDAAIGIARARVLSLEADSVASRLTSTLEVVRVVRIQGDSARGRVLATRDMLIVQPGVDTVSLEFYRRADGRWITCGPPMARSASGRFDRPIAFTGPPADTLRPRGLPVRHQVKTLGWARAQELADSIGGRPARILPAQRTWGGAYASPSDLEVPDAVKIALVQLGCMVPLTTDARDGRRPIALRGALYGPGRGDDWVVACSRSTRSGRASTLYAFGAGRGFAADSVRQLGADVIHDRSAAGQPEPPHLDPLISLTHARGATFGATLGTEQRNRLGLTDSEAAQLMHDGIRLLPDSDASLYWTGARWIELGARD